MKTALTLLLSLLLLTSARAEEPGIEVALKVEDWTNAGNEKENVTGHDLVTAPKVVCKPGKDVKIEIVRDFRQPMGGMIPVGVIMTGKADLKGDKITYSFLLTIREFVASDVGDTQWTSSFKAREYLFSGETVSGKEVTARFGKKGDYTLVSITLTTK